MIGFREGGSGAARRRSLFPGISNAREKGSHGGTGAGRENGDEEGGIMVVTHVAPDEGSGEDGEGEPEEQERVD